jgi:hypothetical protein
MIGVERENLQHVPQNSKRAAATRHARRVSGCIEASDCGYAHSLVLSLKLGSRLQCAFDNTGKVET